MSVGGGGIYIFCGCGAVEYFFHVSEILNTRFDLDTGDQIATDIKINVI